MGLVEALLATYPDCDRMMAETIVKMHEQGKLQEYIPTLSEEPPPKNEGGLIEVHLAEEKSKVKSIEWSEDKSPVSSSLTPP